MEVSILQFRVLFLSHHSIIPSLCSNTYHYNIFGAEALCTSKFTYTRHMNTNINYVHICKSIQLRGMLGQPRIGKTITINLQGVDQAMTCQPSWPSSLILAQNKHLVTLHLCDEESTTSHVTARCLPVVELTIPQINYHV